MRTGILLALCGTGFVLSSAEITVDWKDERGAVKPVNAVGQPPMLGGPTRFGMFRYLKEAGIPYSRLHDVGGWQGQGLWVDIPNLFPDFGADEDDPKSYRFDLTDALLKSLAANGVEPYFRLGVTIENFVERGFRPRRTLPPADFAKWARVCEHVIRHYNEGWANGFRFDIKYWEIWNEPDLDKDDAKDKRTWGGTKAEFFAFYRTAARHLKSCFPHLKIGGPASVCVDRLDWMEDFLKEMAREPRVPLDFYSWHIYFDEIRKPVALAGEVRRLLDKYGYAETESVHNEWNYRKDWSNAFVRDVQTWIGVKGAALDAAAMCAMARTSVDMMMYYDAAPDAVFNGLFDFYTRKPLPAYWAFFYWGDMLKKGTGLKVSIDGAANNDVEAYAAVGRDGSKGLMVACYDDAVPLPDGMKTVVVRLPGHVRNLRLRLVDSKGANRSVPVTFSDGRVTLTLERLSVAYLTWTD